MGETKKDQITFRLEPEAFAETMAGASKEDLKLADFARKLHRLALILYSKSHSLADLRALVEQVPVSPGKTSQRGRTRADK